MGVYACEKVRINIPREFEQPLLEVLQDREIVEIIPGSQAIDISTEDQHTVEALSSEIQTLEQVISTLQTYTANDGKLQALKDPRVRVTPQTSERTANHKEEIIATVKDVSSRIDRLHTAYERRNTLSDTLTTLEPLKDISLPILSEYRFLSFIPLQVHNERASTVINTLYSSFDKIVIEEIKRLKEETVYIVATSKEQETSVRTQIAEEARVLSVPEERDQSFAKTYEELKREYDSLSHEITQIHQELKGYTESLHDFRLVYDLLTSQKQIIECKRSLHMSEDGEHHLLGWVAPERLTELETAVSEITPKARIIRCDRNPEQAKVIMDNPPIIRNFEVVTRIMGLPRGNSLDPTPTLAIFFTIMFGLGFSEAGYALVLLAASIFLMRLPRIKESVRKVSVVIFWASLATLIVGALFGSWFGMNPQTVATGSDPLPHMEFLVNIGVISFLESLQIMNPLEGILPFLTFVIGLGLVHLFVGTILGALQAYGKGDREAALLDNLSFSLFLVLIVLTVIFSVARPFFVGLLIVYGIAMVLASGRKVAGPLKQIANGLFNIYLALIGYLGDTLSYLRLVAIGLATAIIARVIGTLAALAGTPLVDDGGLSLVIGYLIMIVIFVGGHLFNIALNVLGTYVNVGRLHFVEFFKQFFEGGGEEFTPFQKSRKYSIITDKV